MLTKGQKSPALARADAAGEFHQNDINHLTETLIAGRIWAFLMPLY